MQPAFILSPIHNNTPFMCMRVLVRFSLPQLQHCWLRSNLHMRLAFYPTPIKSFQDSATLYQHSSFTAWHPTKTPYT
uniref:WGS project CBMG000000000 data, contig CS5907-c000223 n=1 Tax=Fusarium acuminatum CS5907 TaxID=1318461 RepID=A0A096PE00_9HYPO|nr:unnamed protein product [Fusarium acuminatum CS5907]